MAFKLLEMAQQRWRKLNAPELLPWCWWENDSTMKFRKLTARKRIDGSPLDQTAIHNIWQYLLL